MKVFVASSFNQEQILDSILEQMNQIRGRYDGKSTERITHGEKRPLRVQNKSIDAQMEQPVTKFQGQQREPRFEQPNIPEERSKSRNMDILISEYELDLKKLDKMKDS
jgi:hypothetical protein